MAPTIHIVPCASAPLCPSFMPYMPPTDFVAIQKAGAVPGKLLQDQEMKLEVSDEARKLLAEQGFSRPGRVTKSALARHRLPPS